MREKQDRGQDSYLWVNKSEYQSAIFIQHEHRILENVVLRSHEGKG